MDRRSFLKFMGVTAAATTASKLLANIPEAEPKIQLLEQKTLVTDLSGDTMVFRNVISFDMKVNENRDISSGTFPMFGRRETDAEVVVSLEVDDVYRLSGESSSVRRCMFDVPELRDKLFLVHTSEINSNVLKSITARLSVLEIHNNGVVVM